MQGRGSRGRAVRAPADRRARRARSGRRRAPRPRARSAARPDRADRVRELHLARDPRGRRLGADEQVRRGLSGPALLRRLRDRRRARAARDRPCEGALRRRARERPAARGRPGEHGGLPGPARARRRRPLAPARPRRPPDARPQGQLLRAALHDRPLRGVPGDGRRRRGRGALARARAPAEADPLRRLGLSADGRHRDVPAHRRRGRRLALVRHGALRRARRRGAPSRIRSSTATSSPRRRTRRSPAPAPGSSSAARSTRRRSTARSSRGCRAARSST